eukprot:292260_1
MTSTNHYLRSSICTKSTTNFIRESASSPSVITKSSSQPPNGHHRNEAENRLAACDILEDVITKIKSHSVDVPGLESYTSRQQIDTLINHLKSLTMTLVLPPNINNEISKESKHLASTIQKELGVDTVIIQQNDHIYVHLIGSNSQVNIAAEIIDSRSHKLSKLKGDGPDHERILRRERIRNLNFLDYGVGEFKFLQVVSIQSRRVPSRLHTDTCVH